MTTRPTPTSEWLKALAYIPMAKSYRSRFPGLGFLRVETKDGREYTYAVEPWRFGLLCAHPSPGRAYNLLVKSQCERVA